MCAYKKVCAYNRTPPIFEILLYVMYLYLLSIYLFFLFSLCSSSLSLSFFPSLSPPFPLSLLLSFSLSFFPSLSPSFPLSLLLSLSLSLLFPSDMIVHYQLRLIISCICLRGAQRKWHTQHVSYPYLVLLLLLYSLLSLHC